MFPPPIRCECCGNCPATVVYGEADESGHMWTHYVCVQCHESCSSDEHGNPVHMLPGWPGTAETFDQFVAGR